ncbi:uncharacterized protein LOC132197476 [Neocloeon triangulifer]|uniref:uncharacterized protein LOC132197476 n=1 Tax=Neocloeon triangulifer TaxID=2078957 RepID=UPI00286F4F30|nr:uncharacterized protein LOC132197476 [Neocloeon triangulifer]
MVKGIVVLLGICAVIALTKGTPVKNAVDASKLLKALNDATVEKPDVAGVKANGEKLLAGKAAGSVVVADKKVELPLPADRRRRDAVNVDDSEIKEKLGDKADKVKDTVENAKGKAGEKINEAQKKVSETLSGATDTVGKAAEESKSKVSEMLDKARDFLGL